MKTFAAILGVALMLTVMGADSSIGAQKRSKQATGESDVPLEVRRQIERLHSPDAAARAAAACALGRMEARAAAAIPVLINLLGDGRGVARTCGHEPPFEDEVWQPDFESIRETAVGEAATQALLAIGIKDTGRDRDDNHLTKILGLADRLGRRHTAHARHPQIHQNRIRSQRSYLR